MFINLNEQLCCTILCDEKYPQFFKVSEVLLDMHYYRLAYTLLCIMLQFDRLIVANVESINIESSGLVLWLYQINWGTVKHVQIGCSIATSMFFMRSTSTFSSLDEHIFLFFSQYWPCVVKNLAPLMCL